MKLTPDYSILQQTTQCDGFLLAQKIADVL